MLKCTHHSLARVCPGPFGTSEYFGPAAPDLLVLDTARNFSGKKEMTDLTLLDPVLY
jgi:hypothetical protein